ncbi:phospholipase [Pelagivirga sediminicola]|uniref:Phospholipase D n=1 Tax=Pelagivirga sediminicola TaxID=2170575 RepID=A0A2T7G8E3_9RHOB|nr:phospholipase D family protein [Pelagivirga sediminicola]PVA10676.1 phospholipase [Pelagivirga sediminicola]
MLTLLKYLLLAAALIAIAIIVARIVFALPTDRGAHGDALAPSENGPLAKGLGPLSDAHPGKTGVAALQNGADAFAARIILADAAVSSIDVQYYIWKADLTGALLLDAIKRAADRGVRVRLLLDDNGISGLDPQLSQLDAHPMAEVRLYNPFNLRRFKMLSYTFDFFRLNRRMHNKSFTVDNRVTIMGGRNVGDEYFGTGEVALYVDLDVLVVGDIVPRVSQDFDIYWNSPPVHPATPIVGEAGRNDAIADLVGRYEGTDQMQTYQSILESSDIVPKLTEGTLPLEWTKAVLVSDKPAKGQGLVRKKDLLVTRLKDAVGTINERFDGVSPYFVPGGIGMRNFIALEQGGVQVRMLTNSLEATDVVPVHAGYAKRRKDMLEAGVRLFELRRTGAPESATDKIGPFGSSGSSLHAKTFAVDGERIFVGSFNFDPRSISLNTEMGLLIDSEIMAARLHDAFDTGLGGLAWEVEDRDGDLVWIDPTAPDAAPLTTEPGGSLMRNLAVTIVGWLPVEWLL